MTRRTRIIEAFKGFAQHALMIQNQRGRVAEAAKAYIDERTVLTENRLEREVVKLRALEPDPKSDDKKG